MLRRIWFLLSRMQIMLVMKMDTRIYICMAQQPNSGLGTSFLRFLRHTQLGTHTHTHTPIYTQSHAPSKNPLSEWSARHRGRYLHDTQQTQERIIDDFSGIRTRNHKNYEVASLRLRSHGHDLWGVNNPITGLDRYWEFQQVEAPDFKAISTWRW